MTCWREAKRPMNLTPNPVLVPERGSLPLKKRDPKLSPASQQQPQQCDAATFKAPYPYRSPHESRAKHAGPFQPVPRRAPALYQPWMQIHTPSRSRPHALSAFREHPGWAERRELPPLPSGGDFSHHYHLPPGWPTVHPGYPQQLSKFSPVPLVCEGFQEDKGYDWEQLRTLREKGPHADRQSHMGPYVRRREKKVEYFPKIEKSSPPSASARLPHPPHEGQRDLLQNSPTIAGHPVSERSLRRVSPGYESHGAYTSVKEEAVARSPVSAQPASPNRFPWLLPHFVAGSLIELRDGRLRRVEHLQTEDFLLGSLACPDLRLSCCTVQSISPSASSSISRLLVLLHDLQSQELVDVYAEYPFFVRGQGWSSCSPQRTAHLCGLRCRQLSVGDVCLALTPVSASRPPSSTTPEPKTSPGESGSGCESLGVSLPRALPGSPGSTGGKKREAEVVRRRHYSAPELRGPGTNCM